jgi:hypothetical protein
VNGATSGAFEIALPIVALVEPLYVQRGNFIERRKVADLWRVQANQLKRTNATTHQDAVAAMEDALVEDMSLASVSRESVRSRLQNRATHRVDVH